MTDLRGAHTMSLPYHVPRLLYPLSPTSLIQHSIGSEFQQWTYTYIGSSDKYYKSLKYIRRTLLPNDNYQTPAYEMAGIT